MFRLSIGHTPFNLSPAAAAPSRCLQAPPAPRSRRRPRRESLLHGTCPARQLGYHPQPHSPTCPRQPCLPRSLPHCLPPHAARPALRLCVPQEPVRRWPATCSGQPGRQGPPVPCRRRDPAIPGAGSGVPLPGGCALGPPPFKCCFRRLGSAGTHVLVQGWCSTLTT